jgi:organic radical activating enzyme
MRDKPYCNAPWLGLYYEGTVGLRPCCEWNTNSFPGNYKQYTESKYLKDFKQNMYNDEPVPGCIECTHNEKIGGHSRRKYYDKFTDVDYEASGLQYIARMDFRAGNKCNMMCRMCGPTASSLLEEEVIESGAQEIGFIKHLDTSDVYDLDLGNCKEISILGGEPSIDLDVRKFMNHIADNYPTIKVMVTTNATNASDKWFKTLLRFCDKPGLQIILSVDAAGPTQDFQRKSKISWDTIKKNLVKYREMSKNNDDCSISIQLTCSAITMVTIDTWWDELSSLGITIEPNQVWGPEGMAISCMPTEVKEKSIVWMKKWKEELRTFPGMSKIEVKNVYKAVDLVINILETTEFTGIEQFKELNNRYDGLRGENILNLDDRFKVMMI